MNVLELYKKLSNSEKEVFDTWLHQRSKRVKAAQNAQFLLLAAIKAYIVYEAAKENAQNPLTWEKWMQQYVKVVLKRQKEKEADSPLESSIFMLKDVNNTAVELLKELENFLLYQRKGENANILRLIDLYYIYREKGIKSRKTEIVNHLSKLIGGTNDLYLHYLYQQLKCEDYSSTYSKPNIALLAELDDILNRLLASEYLLRASVKGETAFFAASFLEKYPALKENDLVRFYMDLQTFVLQDFEKMTVQNIADFYEKMTGFFHRLIPTAKVEVYMAFYNKVASWFNNNRTYPRLAALFSYTQKGFEEKWIYVGQYILFPAYNNLMGQCFMHYENDRKKMREELLAYQKRYKDEVIFTKTQADILLQMKINYFMNTPENYATIWAENSAKFGKKKKKSENTTDDAENKERERLMRINKIQFILLQLKSGLWLAQKKGPHYVATFWKGAIKTLHYYTLSDVEDTNHVNQAKIEWALWEQMYHYFLKEDNEKQEAAKKFLQKWAVEQQQTETVFLDKSWYLQQIERLGIKTK